MVRRIKGAVRSGRYELSLHALEEMDEDEMSEDDVRALLLRGRIATRLTNDPAGCASSCAECSVAIVSM